MKKAAMVFCILTIVGVVATGGEKGEEKERHGEGKKEARMHGHILGILMAMDLTDEQRERVRELFKRHRERMKSAVTREEKREAMHALKAELRGILTPEQMEKLREEIRKRREEKYRRKGVEEQQQEKEK